MNTTITPPPKFEAAITAEKVTTAEAMQETAAETVPPEESPAQSVPKREQLEQWKAQMIDLGRTDSDLVRFAKYLCFFNFVKLTDERSELSPDQLYFKRRPVFCQMKDIPKHFSLNHSRLHQCYICELFQGTSSFYELFSTTDPLQSLVGRCSSCNSADTPLAFCPYTFVAILRYISEHLGINDYPLYAEILGEHNLIFPVESESIRLPDELLPVVSQFDARSARAAYLLLQSRFLEINACTDDQIEYQYVPICHSREKASLVTRITDFWKTHTDTFDSVSTFDLKSAVNRKSDCTDCDFESCPYRMAAVFSMLGKQTNISPLDIAYFASYRNTISNLSPCEHSQFCDYNNEFMDIPFIPESNAEILNILRYAVNRSKNPAAPMLPINVVLHVNDETLADTFFNTYKEFLWYFDYFKNGKNTTPVTLSIATTPLEELIKQYEAAEAGTLFHIKQVELLKISPVYDFLMPKLCRIMKEKTDVFTVVSGERTTLIRFFEDLPELYHRTLSHHLFVTEMNAEAVFKLVLSNLEENFTLDRAVTNLLHTYITQEYENSELKSNSYAEWLHEKIVFNHFNNELGVSNVLLPKDIPSVTPRRTEEEIFAELRTFTGLSSVKSKLTEINDLVQYFMKCDRKNVSRPNMHMVFAGNAGTGKTTIARLIAEILYSIGFIQQNKLVVSSGKDLIGEYLGQSQMKTVRKCEQAYDGVLFIDEAYQLNPFSQEGQTDTLKLDAVNELIQQMENNRDRLIVIFAGYTDEMQDFIKNANPGLESRIAYTLDFPDYSDDELLTIFKGIARKEGLNVTPMAAQRATQYIHEARTQGNGFGNARFARNLFEHSLMLHAHNTRDYEKGDQRLLDLTEEDITV